MNTLEEAWSWYTATADSLRRLDRLAEKYWPDLPWDGALGRDNKLRHVEANRASADAQTALDELDDLAIVVLFSVFEATVRDYVASEFQREMGNLAHPVLRKAADDALWVVNEGSFARVLEPYKSQSDADLIEEVNQVRKYRNFVAHGRRGEQPVSITPRAAYDRLTRLLAVVLPSGEGSSE
jgi:hypothetical protein